MPASASIEVKRHYGELSEKQTDEVVDVVADLIVSFLKGQGQHDPSRDNGYERPPGPLSFTRNNQAKQETM